MREIVDSTAVLFCIVISTLPGVAKDSELM